MSWVGHVRGFLHTMLWEISNILAGQPRELSLARFWHLKRPTSAPCSLALSPPVPQIMVGMCHLGFSLKFINVWFRMGLLGQLASELTNMALEFGTVHTSQYRVTYPYPILWSVLSGQSCLTLCDPMACSPPGILQARILEWVAIPFSRGSSWPRD